jgi:hypothetical protein
MWLGIASGRSRGFTNPVVVHELQESNTTFVTLRTPKLARRAVALHFAATCSTPLTTRCSYSVLSHFLLQRCTAGSSQTTQHSPRHEASSWDYLGTYHSRRPHYIYRQRGDAATGPSLRGVEQVTVESKTEDTAHIWVEASPIAPGLEREEPCFLESLVALIDSPLLRVHDHPDGQTPMGNSRPSIDLIWSDHDAAILSIPKLILPRLDMYLPRFFEPVLIPEEPLPLPLEHKEDPRIKEILANLRFDADVASILSGLSLAQMVDDVRWLTGEASNIISRHSFSDGSRVAANWLKKEFESTGAVCDLQPFLEGFAPNVRCLYESEKNNNTTVILGLTTTREGLLEGGLDSL